MQTVLRSARQLNSQRSRGMALIYIILVVLGLGLVGGMVAINVKSQRDEQALNFTVNKMRRLAAAISSSVFDPAAIRHYESDVGAPPCILDSLVTPGPACSMHPSTGRLAGWCGPYWNYTFSGEDVNKDGWNTSFSFSTSPRRIRSLGPNLTNDSGGVDDLDQIY